MTAGAALITFVVGPLLVEVGFPDGIQDVFYVWFGWDLGQVWWPVVAVIAAVIAALFSKKG